MKGTPGKYDNTMEDCYMDVLSPVRACDPWAVHSAKSFEKHSGNTGSLTPIF